MPHPVSPHHFRTNRPPSGIARKLVALGLALFAGVGVASAQPVGDALGDEALSDYTKGVYLLERQLPEEAVPYLTLAWQKSDHDATVGLRLADALFRMGDMRNSDSVLDELMVEHGESYEPLLIKAKIRYLTRRKDEAVTYLEKAQAVSQPTFEASRLAAKIYIELGRDEDALAAYEQAIQLEPYHAYAYYQYGLLLKRFGRYEEAEQAFTDAHRLDPTFSEAALELATMEMEMGRFDDAEAVLLRLIENRGDDFEAIAMISNLYMSQGRYEVAIRLLEAYRRNYDLPREGLFLLGRLYYEAGDFEQALNVFRDVQQQGDDGPEMSRVLGETALKAGHPTEAVEFYRKAIELGPDDYRNYMAFFLATSERFNEGGPRIESLSEVETRDLLDHAAARVEPTNLDGMYLIGVCYLSIDAAESAREYLARAHEIDENDDRILLNLASALEKLHRYEEAEPYLKKLHELKPDDPTVCNFYGYMLALMNKDLPFAEELVRKALKEDPDNGYYIDSLGWVYYQMGEYSKATTELERASDIVGDDATILEHLGDAYRSMRQFRKALAAYERSHELQSSEAVLDKIDTTKRAIQN